MAGNTRKVFLVLMLAQLVATLDSQIVSTALPTIIGALGGADDFAWLVSAYILAQCVVMPIAGKLGDLFGRRAVMVASLVIFMAGSVCCALSWSMPALILSRSLQGLGTGGVLVSVFAINADLFEPSRRARFQSYLSFVFVFGSFVGPALGGALTSVAGWRTIFLVTLPLAALSVAGLLTLLPRTGQRGQPRIDYAGAVSIALAVAMLVVWIDSSRLFGSFLSPGSCALGVAAAIAVVLATRIERRAPEPILPPALLANRDFAFLSLATLCSGAVTVGLVPYYAYFLQMAHGLAPAVSGLFFIALTVGVSAGALLAGAMMARDVSFAVPLRLSLLLTIGTLLAFAALPRDSGLLWIALVFICQGMTVGLSMNALVFGAQVIALPRDMGAATGAISLARTIGAAFGVAIYGAVIALGLTRIVLPEGRAISELTPAILDGFGLAERSGVIAAYHAAFGSLFRLAAIIAAAGFICSCLIRRQNRG